MQAMGHPAVARMVFAVLAPLALIAGAGAGTIEGAVTFPSQVVPALTVYASELDSARVHTARIARGQATFTIEVPPGRYLLFLAPNEPGAPDVYGAYTRYSLCAPHGVDGSCEDHTLIPVAIASKAARVNVTIDDWYLPDETAAQIDHILGAAAARGVAEPLSAPRFSEYPSEAFEPGAAPKIESAAGELSEEDRDIVRQALSLGPNFAGHVTLSLTSCGLACGRIVFIDWRGGVVSELAPPTLSDETQATLPCRPDEALLFRRDSRLLSVTRVRGTAVVTQYYVWNQKSAAPMRGVEYQRPAQAFCAAAAG